MRSQSLFEQQADYQLDVLDAATGALHRAVIIRMLSARLVPVSGTWLAEPETLERNKASKLGRWKSTFVNRTLDPPGRLAGDPIKA